MQSISEVLLEINNKCQQIDDEAEKDYFITNTILRYLQNDINEGEGKVKNS